MNLARCDVAVMDKTREFTNTPLRASLTVILVAVLMVIGACGGRVKTQVNAFASPELVRAEGSIVVKPAREALQSSLEFAHYQSILSEQLATLGYRVTTEEEQAQWVALLDYSVQELNPLENGSKSVYVRDARTTSTLSSGTEITLASREKRAYLRQVSLVIADYANPQKRVYEITGKSEGGCAVLSEVFAPMLKAMLQPFPAKNGAVFRVSIPGVYRC